jgi:pyruvate,water dikinase
MRTADITTKELVISLDEIEPADALRVGGKAFHCARLRQAGFSVPDGIVLTTEMMGQGLDAPALHDWLSKLPPHTLLAVRSSAMDEDGKEHSFAGIHETRLNVARLELPQTIRACWDSVTSLQALAYRQSQHLRIEDVQTAVLIQIMVPAVVAGVAFTVNPVTQSTDEIVVNSAIGSGEALVSGRVDPDEFRVRKADGQILMSAARTKPPSLSDAQLQELVKILMDIERYFGAPQDVEWCHDGTQFWIVQSRPVTTESRRRKSITWTRANAREVLPELPSPMTVYPIADAVEEAQRRFQGRLMAPESELGRFAQVFYGRLYFNVDQIRYTCRMAAIAPAVILRSMGHDGPIPAEDEVLQTPGARDLVRVLPDLLRMTAGQLLAARKVEKHKARILKLETELGDLDFATMADRHLWAELCKYRPHIVEELQLVFTLTGVSAYEQALRSICEHVGMSYEHLAFSYLAAGEKSVSSAQGFDLLRLSLIAREEPRARNYFSQGRQSFEDYRTALQATRFLESFDAFLKLYGHRGHYESDLALPRYNEDPSPLLFAIQLHVQATESPQPDKIIKRQNLKASAAWKEFRSKLRRWQHWILAPVAWWLLRRIKQFYLWRELCRSNMVRVGWPMRLIQLELANRFVKRGWIEARDDYFFLIPSDIERAMTSSDSGPSLAFVVARRKAEWQRFANIEMPLLMNEANLAVVRGKADVSDISDATTPTWKGLCVSPGCVEAEVVVLNSPAEFWRMKRGAILVTNATDPSWTPLFTLAAGVIVEIGGILSHASTVAREYGVPAIANLKNATKIFKDGTRVRLDATNGVVRLCSTDV